MHLLLALNVVACERNAVCPLSSRLVLVDLRPRVRPVVVVRVAATRVLAVGDTDALLCF